MTITQRARVAGKNDATTLQIVGQELLLHALDLAVLDLDEEKPLHHEHPNHAILLLHYVRTYIYAFLTEQQKLAQEQRDDDEWEQRLLKENGASGDAHVHET